MTASIAQIIAVQTIRITVSKEVVVKISLFAAILACINVVAFS